MTSPDSPHTQSFYQVRFDWGIAGAEALAGSDAIVWVDELGTPQVPSVETNAVVVAGGIANAAAVAEWMLAKQEERRDRFRIAVVAAGEHRPDGSLRFAVEDQLGAGAVIDALTAVGLDHCSPEAAAASAAYFGLRRATKHLLGATVTSRQLGGVQIDLTPTTAVPVLIDFADKRDKRQVGQE
ncbi:2-phosphosulfolactate phosphatase [Salinibacterium hongtaonis]|uniref:2-phosphosulfolactate phosphatase n=1 Tax=Homoserinimonas hongtaonis TaxID=2079791 RepID=UPI000D376BF4|nr:2-phosphosulfolactate phosphatase [Salinibacterium hongtaonis]AWB90029.1 hypothetical protein C2138_11175 [Salinibacterium hongtaonis]